jgi:AcrR family transcriptional regulator
MNDRPPSGLERLWGGGQGPDRKPRLGLSLDRIVESGVEIADKDGLAGVSMKRVAEALGFTTMSLYRYVASKDDLLLLMHDTVWQPPPGLDAPLDGWRSGIAHWTREQFLIMQRHPWLEQVRHIDRAGTPSQVAWMELGLRALAETPLTEYQKVEVLLVLSGYVFSTARNAGTVADGARQGLFSPEQATEAFGELLRGILDPGRFAALFRAVEGGAFSTDAPFPDFDFGLELMLDGVDGLIRRQASR